MELPIPIFELVIEPTIHISDLERSAEAMSAKRKILVCAQNKCHHCESSVRTIPDYCQFTILHVLETNEFESKEMPRRSGKTTKLVSMANQLDEAGFLVYYITENELTAKKVMERYGLEDGVRAMGWRQAINQLRGVTPGVVLVDEVQVNDLEQLRSLIGSKFNVLAHYWTRR